MKKVVSSAALSFAALLAINVQLAHASEPLLVGPTVKVTQEDYEQLLKAMIPDAQRKDLLLDDRKNRQLLAEYYVTEALAEEARKQGLDKTPEFIFRQQYEAKRALAQQVLNKAALDAKKPDFEKLAREDYQVNKKDFAKPTEVRASHILIAINDKRDEAQAKVLADEVYKKLQSKPESFDALVKEYSDDPSAKTNEGDLGFFPRDRMVKPFGDAVFSMSKKGEISKPVKTQFGYHIIRLVDRREGGQQTFDDVKSELIQKQESRFYGNVQTQKVESIRADKNIKFNEAAFKEFVQRNTAGK